MSGAMIVKKGVTDSLAPILLARDENHLFGPLGPAVPIFLTVWKRMTKPEDVIDLQRSYAEFASSFPGRAFGALTIVQEAAPLPSSAARNALMDLFEACSSSILASALVMEGDGFRASAVRSVATGLSIATRQPFPHVIFSNITDGSAWLAGQLDLAGYHVKAPWIVSAITRMRTAQGTSLMPPRLF